METGPTVILTTSVTASSSSSASSLNSSISIMTMGAGNSTLTPPFTGPKRLTKPVFGACDMLDVNSKSVWPESKLDSTRCAIPGLGDSRHSASDTQLGNSCVSLARHQSPVTLSDDLHTANETPSCRSSPSPTNTLIHVTLSIPYDLPANTLCVRTQNWEQPNSCPNSHTRLNHEPQLRQQPRQNSEQSTHVPMAQPAAVVLQSADRQPLIAQLNPLIADSVSDITCPGSRLKRPNKMETNEKTCTSPVIFLDIPRAFCFASVCPSDVIENFQSDHVKSSSTAHSISMVALTNDALAPEFTMQPIGERDSVEGGEEWNNVNTANHNQEPLAANSGSFCRSHVSAFNCALSEPGAPRQPMFSSEGESKENAECQVRHLGDVVRLPANVHQEQLVGFFKELPRRRYAPEAQLKQRKLERVQRRHRSGELRNPDIFDSDIEEDDDLSADAAIAELHAVAEAGRVWATGAPDRIPQVRTVSVFA
ncbi:uncharacterized protein DEA37_0006701 [Paragonimus westermani]|uniref:Uncharacterized protein n=1 Tax=Paragonimus westermani TaxID=34504 RepID=A0A5J4N6D1_9TREM|nr:uncharacterized protein DEA37_0006701 [Paragonimus westermani]